MIWFDKHRRFRDDLSAYADGQLPPGPLTRLEAHLKRCDSCHAELDGLRSLSAALRQMPIAPAPRSFVLNPQQAATPAPPARRYASPQLAFGARIAGAALAFALAVVVIIDLGGVGGSGSESTRQAAPPEAASAGVNADKSLPDQAPGAQAAVPAPTAGGGVLFGGAGVAGGPAAGGPSGYDPGQNGALPATGGNEPGAGGEEPAGTPATDAAPTAAAPPVTDALGAAPAFPEMTPTPVEAAGATPAPASDEAPTPTPADLNAPAPAPPQPTEAAATPAPALAPLTDATATPLSLPQTTGDVLRSLPESTPSAVVAAPAAAQAGSGWGTLRLAEIGLAVALALAIAVAALAWLAERRGRTA